MHITKELEDSMSVEGLMLPSKRHAELMGIYDLSLFSDKINRYSPLFLKAFKDYYLNSNAVQVQSNMQTVYYELWHSGMRPTSNGLDGFTPWTSISAHEEFWLKMWNVKSEKLTNANKKLFPSEVANSTYGLKCSILNAIKDYDSEEIKQISFRNLSPYAVALHKKSDNRTAGFEVLLAAAIDNKDLIDLNNDNQVKNLGYFYNNLSVGHPNLLKSWLSDDWNHQKEAFLTYTETLQPSVLAKLVDSDLTVSLWAEHADMPREWLINLYKNA